MLLSPLLFPNGAFFSFWPVIFRRRRPESFSRASNGNRGFVWSFSGQELILALPPDLDNLLLLFFISISTLSSSADWLRI